MAMQKICDLMEILMDTVILIVSMNCVLTVQESLRNF